MNANQSVNSTNSFQTWHIRFHYFCNSFLWLCVICYLHICIVSCWWRILWSSLFIIVFVCSLFHVTQLCNIYFSQLSNLYYLWCSHHLFLHFHLHCGQIFGEFWPTSQHNKRTFSNRRMPSQLWPEKLSLFWKKSWHILGSTIDNITVVSLSLRFPTNTVAFVCPKPKCKVWCCLLK